MHVAVNDVTGHNPGHAPQDSGGVILVLFPVAKENADLARDALHLDEIVGQRASGDIDRKTWNSSLDNCGEARGRGGRSGRMHQVKVDSLPPKIQARLKGHLKPVEARLNAAGDYSRTEARYSFSHHQPHSRASERVGRQGRSL